MAQIPSPMMHLDENGDFVYTILPSSVIETSVRNTVSSLQAEIAELREIIIGLQTYAES